MGLWKARRDALYREYGHLLSAQMADGLIPPLGTLGSLDDDASTIVGRVRSYFRAHPATPTDADAIARELGIGADALATVRTTLGRLADGGEIERSARGLYIALASPEGRK
jgi:hypothetical protein